MARTLKVRVTNHSYADVQLLLAAQKMDIRRDSRRNLNVELSTLKDILDAKCTVSQVKYFLQEFHKNHYYKTYLFLLLRF